MCNCRPTRLPLAVLQSTAGMCSACSKRAGTRCGVTGLETQHHRQSMHCPQRRFPDGSGRVRWMGVLWSGVPYPVRLWLVLLAKVERPEDFAGCGCLVAAKGLIARLAVLA